MAWLDSVNREKEQRGAPRLERCLLAANGDVFRVPWEDVVYPQFISRPQTSLKEEKKSSVQDGDLFINTSTNQCRETSGQDVKLLPASTKTDQSQASSDDSDSEGEYVELSELPLPRFSPQKGSLTQSISLQLRARTSTPQNSPTTTKTPATPPTADTHTAAANTHNAHNTHTREEVSSHTELCTRLIEENLNQDLPGPIILTPISSSSSSSSTAAPPAGVETSDCPSEQETSAERTEGTDTGSEPGERRREEDEGEREKEGEIEGEREEEEKKEVEVLDDDDDDEGEGRRKDLDDRRSEGLLLLSHTAEEGGEKEECESETEEEEDEDEAEEVEVEEEVQFIIVQHSQDRRNEEVEKGMREEEGENRGGEEEHTDQEVYAQAEGSYFESDTQHTRSENSNTPPKLSEGSYCEGDSQQKLSEDSYSEKNTIHSYYEDSYSENNNHTPSKDSYSENNNHTPSKDSYFENNVHIEKHKHSEDCYYETNSEDSKPHPQESETPAVDPDPHRTGPEGPENSQEKLEEEEKKKKEEEEEKCCCEEVGGGGRTAELQTEGLNSQPPPARSHVDLPDNPSPAEPEPLPAVTAVPVRFSQSSKSHQSHRTNFYNVLRNSAALCLPGTRDRSGRPLLTICTKNPVWSNPDCESAELLRLLLYYTSTLRKEVMALGLTVLVDARRAAPLPVLFSALRSLQENIPGSIHSVLLLINKDSSLRLDKPAAALQVEVVNSLKSVQKHVELRQLPAEFGGSFSFSQSSWLCFRSRVEQLTRQCEDVINLLQKTINILQSTPLPAEAQDAELQLSRYKAVMLSILEDSRLVQLQQEGGALLSRLRREDSGLGETEDYRAAVESVSTLYNEVDELLHRLVTLSNSRTQELNFILEFSRLEEGFTQVRSWLEEVGEVHLKSLNEPDDSLELLNKKQQDFKDFHTTAYDHCRQGEELLSRLERWSDVSSADLRVYEVKVHSFWAKLQDFSQRVKITGKNIERAVCLYRFLDQAYGWALEGMRHLAGVTMEECTLPDKCQAVIGCLEDYKHQHPPIPDSRFQEMKALAEELRGERGLRQWSFAWSKCQETKKMFDRKMEAALRTRDSAHRQRSDSNLSRNSTSSRKSLSGLLGVFDKSSSSSCSREEVTSSPLRSTFSSQTSITSSPPTSSTLTPQHTPLLQRLLRSPSSEESSDQVDFCSSSPSLPHLGSCHSFTPSLASSPSTSSFSSSSRRHQLRKTQSFDCPSTPEPARYGPNPRALSEPVRRGNTGVFIRGLEVSSSEAADHTLCPRTVTPGWAGVRSPGTPSTPRTNGSPATESRPRGSKLRHVVEEMVTTEREYVRSLGYIIRHYFPMMDRTDLPQDLRGKRSVVFGNLEKLLDFHSQFFLRELESCWKHPLRVPHCFLRHQEQFGLYALYSKNKPKSDALLALHGHSFFRRKQVELGDRLDLSSYLLKPIQRMSKYALLLTDLMKEVGGAQEAEHVALQAATSMVKFQLRHGNDLLAMDAIRDCDVNLKEQGQLIRQDEFTVWTGRRKCQRHIFLFEELVLFSKPKKMEGGLDVFIYKHSFKTADVGLTESTGDNGLRFEIWFRRRTSKNQTFTLQAGSAEVKHAWTSDIARILWTQATKNKEMRLKEMVSMGVGNKPFLDIQPSDAAISDRAVHYIMKSRGARTRASIAVSVFDHSNPFKRGVASSDSGASGPSSTSLLGPLNLHMYSQTLSSSPAAESSFITSCIEEDEQEHETSSQPSMTTESSGSSSRCLSGSTGSDSGCVSSHLQEALPEEPSPTSQPSFSSSSSSCSSSNKQHLNSQYISPKSAPVISPATIV